MGSDIDDIKHLHTLESVPRYIAGDWEHKIDKAYQNAIDLGSQWQEVNSLVKELSTAPHTPDDIVKLVEATKNPAQTIKLLALGNRDTICEPLASLYLSISKVKEARCVVETLLEVYPKEAHYHLFLGNMFASVCHNSVIAADSILLSKSTELLRGLIEDSGQTGAKFLDSVRRRDPLWYKVLTDREHKPSRELAEFEQTVAQITLEGLDCSFEFARKAAEKHLMEAMRLSKDKGVREQAKQSLLTLRMVDVV